MKKLRCALAMLLVLSLCAGITGTAAAATFDDDADIAYAEAVEAMTALGAIDGMGDGTFNPTGPLTRAAAAKLLAFLALGADAARLVYSESSFSDVIGTDYEWASPYIEFCHAGGYIIDTEVEGLFNPQAGLSTLDFACCILQVLGEQVLYMYVGGTTAWLMSRISHYSLADDFLMSLEDGITRERACQMVFNAMSDGPVSHSQTASRFEDYGEVEPAYTDAVDVLVGTGVIEGTTVSTLGPKGAFTREQAAKIVTDMKLGASETKSLIYQVHSFDDVEGDRWSAGYIGYCASEGIISGNGPGRFSPTDPVTGTETAKMLLVAIGYDPDKYEGAGWGAAVAGDARDSNLLLGAEGALSGSGAQREEAMKFTYNAMFYDPSLGEVDLTRAAPGSIAAETYGLSVDEGVVLDSAGAPLTSEAVLVATFTQPVTMGDIKGALGVSGAAAPETLTFTLDGGDAVEVSTNSGDFRTERGVITRLYRVGDSGGVYVSALSTWLGTVGDGIITTGDGDALPAPGVNEFYEPGDTVIFRRAGSLLSDIRLASPMELNVTGFSVNTADPDLSTFTAGGETYSYSRNLTDGAVRGTGSYKVYMDGLGNVIKAIAPTGPAQDRMLGVFVSGLGDPGGPVPAVVDGEITEITLDGEYAGVYGGYSDADGVYSLSSPIGRRFTALESDAARVFIVAQDEGAWYPLAAGYWVYSVSGEGAITKSSLAGAAQSDGGWFTMNASNEVTGIYLLPQLAE